MRGAPLAKAKDLVHGVLATLRPDDTFQVVRFADTAAALAAAPIANKPRNLELALHWVDALEAGGATEVTAGLDTAFAQPHDARRMRIVVFVGDGYVGDEDAILARATAELGTARLFCFGVGSAVNRYLLEELARVGRGALQVVRPDADTQAATAQFVRRVDAPLVTDVTIDWAGLPVSDLTPAPAPSFGDVFLGQPLVVSGHYAGAAAGTITLHGIVAGERVSMPLAISLPAADGTHRALGSLWARARIGELSRQLVRRADKATEQQILALSLAHHILTRFTAFVAVDDSRTTAGGDARKVAVPVEVPDAVQGIGPAGYGTIYGGGTGAGWGDGMIGYGAGGGGLFEGAVGYGMAAGGAGTGYGIGGGYGGLHANLAEPTKLVFGQATAEGDLDKAIIRRYLKRNREKLMYCYEKALLAVPGLHGQLVLQFTIAGGGTVSASAATGVADSVATCAADVVRAIEFPRPKDGGSVLVSFPLELTTTTTAHAPGAK